MEDMKMKIKDALSLIDSLAHSLNDIFVAEDAESLAGETVTKDVLAMLRLRAVGTLDHFGLLTDTPAVNPVVGDLRRWLASASVMTPQDPKYGIRNDGLYNRASGQLIPDDEPIFIFRARDSHAVNVLADYARRVKDGGHASAVWARVEDFKKFWDEHPDQMKEPDTAPAIASN